MNAASMGSPPDEGGVAAGPAAGNDASATPRVPAWITGAHSGVAVRVSDHPGVVALCRAFGGPIVSTSANLAGEPPAFTLDALSPEVLAQVDGVMEGETGGLRAPTAIRDALTGGELRAG